MITDTHVHTYTHTPAKKHTPLCLSSSLWRKQTNSLWGSHPSTSFWLVSCWKALPNQMWYSWLGFLWRQSHDTLSSPSQWVSYSGWGSWQEGGRVQEWDFKSISNPERFQRAMFTHWMLIVKGVSVSKANHLSLSLSLTHTHTHTLSLSLTYGLPYYVTSWHILTREHAITLAHHPHPIARPHNHTPLLGCATRRIALSLAVAPGCAWQEIRPHWSQSSRWAPR